MPAVLVPLWRGAGEQGHPILTFFQASEDQDRDQGIGPAVEAEDLAGLGIRDDLHGVFVESR